MEQKLKTVNYVCDLELKDLGIVLPCYGSIEEPLFWWRDVRNLGNGKEDKPFHFLRTAKLDKDECFHAILGKCKYAKKQHGGLRSGTTITVLTKKAILKVMSRKTGYDNSLILNISKYLLSEDEIKSINLDELNLLKDNCRDEIDFFKNLKDELQWWKEDFIFSYLNGSVNKNDNIRKEAERMYRQDIIHCNDITLELQKPVCDGKYRIDCYIPEFQLVIEYDEQYHKYQKDKDRYREIEISDFIMREDLYKKYFNRLKEIEELGYNDIVDFVNDKTDLGYNKNDYIEFIRVEQGNEKRMLQFIKNRLMYKYL